jgi:hypothetical protein
MSTDYGTDVQALDDLPDAEVLVSQELEVAYDLAGRLITDPEAMTEIGDTSPYDSINLRDWLGARFNLNDPTVLDDLQRQARQVLLQDKRVSTVNVTVTFTRGTLSVSVDGNGVAGPFAFVTGIDNVGASFLRGV